MWDVKEPTHYSTRVVVVQVGVTCMSMLAKSSWYKLGLCDNWGLNALVRNFISRKIIITYEKLYAGEITCIETRLYFEFTEVFINLTLDLNS